MASDVWELIYAEMSEWLKEHDWKSCDGGTRPEVQILFSAPYIKRVVAFRYDLIFYPFLPNRSILNSSSILRQHRTAPTRAHFAMICVCGDRVV